MTVILWIQCHKKNFAWDVEIRLSIIASRKIKHKKIIFDLKNDLKSIFKFCHFITFVHEAVELISCSQIYNVPISKLLVQPFLRLIIEYLLMFAWYEHFWSYKLLKQVPIKVTQHYKILDDILTVIYSYIYSYKNKIIA